MAAHSSIFAWKIPWTEECGRLWSKESDIPGDLPNPGIEPGSPAIADRLVREIHLVP